MPSPPTEPQPVTLEEIVLDGVPIVRLTGTVEDPGAMVRLAQELIAGRVDGGHVVLDLDGLDVRDPSALCAFLARLGAASGGVAIPTACGDPSLRRLLRACGASSAGLACFSCVEEAMAVARPSLALA